jgi:hypothetical protein
MSYTYASGKNAIGLCQRCGFLYKLSKLRPDGENELLVCATCYDVRHPAKTPIRTADPIALQRPAPDTDAANADVIDDSRPLGEVLGFTNFFGEQP